MEGVTIQTKHVFGIKSDVGNCISHLDEHRVLYPAGHNVVLYNTDDRDMSFFPGLEGSLGITCMAVCPRRRFLAVAERAEKAVVTVYDTHAPKKRKILVTSDCLSQEYISMAFAPRQERKFLITMGSKPDWVLVFWQWDRPRVISTARVSNNDPVYQVSFNILDYQSGIIATGNKILKGFRPGEGTLKPQNPTVHKKESHLSINYLCHSWLYDGRLVVGTDNGEILIFNQAMDYSGPLTCNLENWSALCIIPYSNGFLVGGEEGKIAIFERNPDDARLHYMRSGRTLSIAR